MKLDVWNKAKDLAVYIYQLTDKGKLAKDFSLKDQLRRAAVSVASNIAEGDERGTNKESVRFFYVARGSAAEVLTQAIIAKEIGYIEKQDLEYLRNEATMISRMLYRLIKARQRVKGEG
jgi:four helix bundle protein